MTDRWWSDFSHPFLHAQVPTHISIGVSPFPKAQERGLRIDGLVSLRLEPARILLHDRLPNPGDPCAARLAAHAMPDSFVQVDIDARIPAG